MTCVSCAATGERLVSALSCTSVTVEALASARQLYHKESHEARRVSTHGQPNYVYDTAEQCDRCGCARDRVPGSLRAREVKGTSSLLRHRDYDP